MRKLLFGLLSLTLSAYMYAQQPASSTRNAQPWERYLNELSDVEDFENVTWEDYYDLLNDYAEHPINLNTATREDLERLPFLSAQQIEDLLAYIYQYGGMKSRGELAMIESLDWYQRKLLEYFTYLGDTEEKRFPRFGNILKYGRHELIATARVPFYERKGDRNGYLGYKYKHWLKYTFRYGDYVKIGLLGSQDAGEPFFAGRNSAGYDFYSFYAQIRKLGPLKNLTLGRYRLRFGMGLVMNTDFGLGKVATLMTLGRTGNSIRGHGGRSAANCLQGAAATVNLWKGLDLSAFVSYRYIDATLNKDTNTIATILKTGYHRTRSEMERKNNASEFLVGTHLNYFRNGFHIGATALYNAFDRSLQPKVSQSYRRWYAAGSNFYNMSVDYGYVSRRLTVSGETATGDSKALATINTVSYLLTDELSLIALQRFYSYRYTALHAESFSEGGTVQNENGVYLGFSWNPSRRLSLMGYTDYAYFIWPKYQADASTYAWDNMLSATYKPGRFTFLARYRIKMRQKNNADKSAIISDINHRGRLSVGYDGDLWSTKTQGDIAYDQYKNNSFGWMLSQNLLCRWRFLRANASLGYFHTKDYSSRVYTYEPGTLYNLNFPCFYGHGLRYAFTLRADFNSHLMAIMKLGTTDYFDRNHISSGYQRIDRSSQTDLDLQLRWKF